MTPSHELACISDEGWTLSRLGEHCTPTLTEVRSIDLLLLQRRCWMNTSTEAFLSSGRSAIALSSATSVERTCKTPSVRSLSPRFCCTSLPLPLQNTLGELSQYRQQRCATSALQTAEDDERAASRSRYPSTLHERRRPPPSTLTSRRHTGEGPLRLRLRSATSRLRAGLRQSRGSAWCPGWTR